MKRRQKTPAQIRTEAFHLAMQYSDERMRCGDPEGSAEFGDLAVAISQIEMSEPAAQSEGA